jgi:hypothetical protein
MAGMEANALQSLLGTLSIGLPATTAVQNVPVPAAGLEMPTICMVDAAGQEHIVFDGTNKALDTAADDANRYHVLYVLGGTVYFGQLRVHPQHRTVGLDDGHYLVPSKSKNAGLQLIRIGQELHAPNGEMTVNMTYVVSWQKLSARSAIMTAI